MKAYGNQVAKIIAVIINDSLFFFIIPCNAVSIVVMIPIYQIAGLPMQAIVPILSLSNLPI